MIDMQDGRYQTVRGRLVRGVATLESNYDNQALLVVVLEDMKPGQKVVFTVEEDVT